MVWEGSGGGTLKLTPVFRVVSVTLYLEEVGKGRNTQPGWVGWVGWVVMVASKPLCLANDDPDYVAVSGVLLVAGRRPVRVNIYLLRPEVRRQSRQAPASRTPRHQRHQRPKGCSLCAAGTSCCGAPVGVGPVLSSHPEKRSRVRRWRPARSSRMVPGRHATPHGWGRGPRRAVARAAVAPGPRFTHREQPPAPPQPKRLLPVRCRDVLLRRSRGCRSCPVLASEKRSRVRRWRPARSSRMVPGRHATPHGWGRGPRREASPPSGSARTSVHLATSATSAQKAAPCALPGRPAAALSWV